MKSPHDPLNEALIPLSILRFRVLMTAAMQVISLHDSIALARNPSPRLPTPSKTASSRLTHVHFKSAANILHGNLVLPLLHPPKAVVVILHGIADRLDYWGGVQHLLAFHGVASLIFDYTGYGRTPGPITPGNLRQDALAANRFITDTLPGVPHYVLGYSMGTAVATDAAAHLDPRPHGLILCQAFPSLREAASSFAPTALSRLLPDVWRTSATLALSDLPLLLIHGDADELFPHRMATQIHEAALSQPNRPVWLASPPGFSHNQAYQQPSLDYWQALLDFIDVTAPKMPISPDL